jgi:predicted metal-binding membrane protein
MMVVIQKELKAPVSVAAALPVNRTGVHRLGVWLAVSGWALLAVMWMTGSAAGFGHDQEGLPATLAIVAFLMGWIVMVAAMMLPSSLPTLKRVDQALAAAEHTAASGFMVGYFIAWAVFGAAAFAGDGILHLSVGSMPWLAERPSLILGGAAMFAGLAEFRGRTPPPIFPMMSPDGGSFSLGKAHAVDRIRRCWPLMLFAMAVGMSNPAWMVGVTLVMALELRPRASTALRFIGLVVFALGAAVVIEPAWMSALFGSA